MYSITVRSPALRTALWGGPPPPGPRYEPGGQTVYRGRDTSGYLFHDGLQLVVGKLPAQMLQLPLRDIAHVVLDRHSFKRIV